MPFTPTTWADGQSGGTPITAAQLNRIEAGIAEAEATTWETIAGKPVVVAAGADAAAARTAISLGSVDNTSDATKPVSTAQQAALDAKVAKGDLLFNVKDYLAKGDAVVTTAGMTSGSAALTKTSGSFTSADVGKKVVVVGAGTTRSVTDAAITSGASTLTSATAAFVSGDIRSVVVIPGAGAAGADLTAYISKVISATQVSLATRTSGGDVATVTASATVSGAAVSISAYLVSSVASVSSGVATLAANAGHTVTGASLLFGTDDTVAINAAMTAAIGGGTVLLPAGKYLTTDSISIDNANYVHVRGGGDGATTIYGAGGFLGGPLGGKAIFFTRGTFTVSTAPLTKFTMSDLTLDGIYTQGTYSVDYCGIRATAYVYAGTFRDMTIRNTLATGFGLDNLFGGTSVHNCRALHCGAAMWGVGGGCAGIGIGLTAEFHNDFTVTGCYLVGNGTYGLFIETGNGVGVKGAKIIGCAATRNKIAGFADCGGYGAIWQGCWSYINDLDGFLNGGTNVSGVPGQDTIYDGCIAWGNQRNGFGYLPFQQGLSSNPAAANPTCRVSYKGCKSYVNNVRGWEISSGVGTVEGLRFDNCEAYQNTASGLAFTGGGTVKNVSINGGSYYNNNTSNGSDSAGIRFAAGAATDVTIRNTRCYDTNASPHQTHGLMFSSGLTMSGLIVEGNDLRGNVTNPISFGATLTGTQRFRNNAGYNPVGAAIPGAAFALAATGVAWVNGTGVDVTLYCTVAGTVTSVAITSPLGSGVTLAAMAVGHAYRVPAGMSFTVNYSAAPTLVAVGD